MSEDEKKKLEEIIKMGKWNFIIVRGMLMWGSLMAILMILFTKYIIGDEMNLFTINLNIIIFWIAGLIWGSWVWNKANKKLKDK